MPFEVRDYLTQRPTFRELQTLQQQLRLPPIEWVRTTDEAWLMPRESRRSPQQSRAPRGREGARRAEVRPGPPALSGNGRLQRREAPAPRGAERLESGRGGPTSDGAMRAAARAAGAFY